MQFTELSTLRIAFELLSGFVVSIELAAIVLVISAVFGFFGGVLATTAPCFIRAAIQISLILVRGVPLLFQVFAIFYILPLIGPRLSPFLTATVALSLFGSLTITEIVRGAINSISVGQTEAACALGLRSTGVMMYVIVPQAMRTILPSLVGQFVWLIKGTSVISLLGVPELLYTGHVIIERTLQGFQVMSLVWVYYTAICLPVSVLGRHLEAKLHARGFHSSHDLSFS